MNVLVINGPNLNMLGLREPEVYGYLTYSELERFIKETAGGLKIDVEIFQSNSEGEIVDRIQEADVFDGILINAGAYTHTSVAIRDALLAVAVPFVEVHLTNIFSREDFRKHSYISDVAVGVITGFGRESYRLGLMAVAALVGEG
jgi:3-dehydroquinate dehydratase-2